MTEPRLFDDLAVPMILPNRDIPRTRRSDPPTSHEAADTNNIHASIGLVLAALTDLGPLADHELVARLATSFTEQRLRSARAALVEMGLVEFSGFYRLTANNRRARVWQSTRRAA